MSSHFAAKDSNYFRSYILKMYGQELDSFVLKLKNLWKAGRNASLNIQANTGNLSVELDPDDHVLHPQHGIQRHCFKNGPAHQKRR